MPDLVKGEVAVHYSAAAGTPDGSAGVARGQEGGGCAAMRDEQPQTSGEAPDSFDGAGAGDDPHGRDRTRSAVDAAVAAATAAAAVTDSFDGIGDDPQAHRRRAHKRWRCRFGGAAFDAEAAASDANDTDDADAPPAKKGRGQAHGQVSNGAAMVMQKRKAPSKQLPATTKSAFRGVR
jgi:hypothetical protein